MREVEFLQKNRDKWEEFESLLRQGQAKNPDKLADLYIQLTDDLSWARTYYPGSKTTEYLNQLTVRAHESIYRNKKEDRGRIVAFWRDELPAVYFKHRHKLLTSLGIFIVAVMIGVVSAANEPMFVRSILGDQYVNMTLHNVQNNDPMAVYKSSNAVDMFWGITLNNIRVSFIAFVCGLLASLGTGLVLMQNGIMMGAFFHLFFQQGFLAKSLMVVFIHGTLEISAIIIAGGAGLTLGSGILYPGTYSRLTSFRRSAKEGLKMTTGLIPIFIAAGFLESFVTRFTEMPVVLSLFIIGSSLVFIIWYFVLYPNQYVQKQKNYESTI